MSFLSSRDRLPGESVVDGALRSINAPDRQHRNTPVLMRLLVAAGAAFVIPWLARTRMPDGWPMWPFSIGIGLVGGWIAGRYNQWERQGDFDPWAEGVPAQMRWWPAVSSVAVSAVAAALMVYLGVVGVGGKHEYVTEAPTSTTTAPTSTTAAPTSTTSGTGATSTVPVPTSIAPTVDAPTAAVDAANQAVAAWFAGAPVPNLATGVAVAAPPPFTPARYVTYPTPGGGSVWLMLVQAENAAGQSMWVNVTVTAAGDGWQVTSLGVPTDEGG